MAIKTLKTGICANCKKEVSYYVIENNDNCLNLSNYNLFKKPTINVCSHCGYINSNLEEDNIFKNIISKDDYTENTNLLSSLKDKNYVANKFLNNVLDNELKLRTLSFIFENNKLIYNVFLEDNYTKQDEQTITIIREIKKNLKNSCLDIISLLDNNNIENNFVLVLKIEVLSCLNKIGDADKILKSLKKELSADLFDYLEECLEIGGLV